MFLVKIVSFNLLSLCSILVLNTINITAAKPGEVLRVRVDALLDRGTESLRQLDIAERQCKFKDETEGLQFMRQYTEKGCEFECRLRKATEACGGCIPWDYPRLKGNLQKRIMLSTHSMITGMILSCLDYRQHQPSPSV